MLLSTGSTEFFKNLATYFMDFLETDFHKRRLPKRVLKFRNKDNLLIGFQTRKYETFNQNLRKIIRDGFSDNESLLIEKGKHKTKIPQNVFKYIKLQIEEIKNDQVERIINSSTLIIKKNCELFNDSIDEAILESKDEIKTIFLEILISDFVNSLQKPLENANLGDTDDLFMIEEELTEIFAQITSELIDDQIIRLLAKQKVDIEREFVDTLNLSEIKVILEEYFINLQVSDLYQEIFEMVRNQRILDKQEFYLYFMDISYRDNKYPIFYIPIHLDYLTDAYHINFDSQMFINKKALEYIIQEVNAERGTKGTLKNIGERIIYLAQNAESTKEIIATITRELIDFFNLSGELNFNEKDEVTLRGQNIQISNAAYLSLFDKSDEALINDYEEILEALNGDDDSTDLADAFNKILEDFLISNPVPVSPEVEKAWEDTGTTEKLVVPSPIPLNSEQIKILKALNDEKSKYLVVEGPPGTGKSHTITAIIFDAILKSKSVLVLSDKKEALDVVEKNIKASINKVRIDENFQNPILRLGKTGNTYSQILAKSTISNIRDHLKAVNHQYKDIDDVINSEIDNLQNNIKQEIDIYANFDLKDVSLLVSLENEVNSLEPEHLIFEKSEISNWLDISKLLDQIRNFYKTFDSLKSDKNFNRIEKCIIYEFSSLKLVDDIQEFVDFINLALEISGYVRGERSFIDEIPFIQSMDQNKLIELKNLTIKFGKARGFLFGYRFKQDIVHQFNESISEQFITTDTKASENINRIWSNISTFESIVRIIKSELARKPTKLQYFYIEALQELVYNLVFDEDFRTYCLTIDQKFYKIKEKFVNAHKLIPETSKKLKLDYFFLNLDKVSESILLTLDEDKIALQLQYLELNHKLRNSLFSIPEYNYNDKKQDIESLVTSKATNYLDEKLINFYDYNKNDAESIKSIIKKKQKFPKKDFELLKNAFPCILSGIRDFADYIPMQFEMFDLLIIDEASQVSMAQAFPALLRAKQVLILGDRKQFSNVKSAQARSDTNTEYLNDLRTSFKKNVSQESIQLERLTKFNIKTSILDFFEFISNYSTQLLKHFRGYKELISYSNNYFYQNSLQVMKIRSKNIEDVIKFTILDEDLEDKNIKNTNLTEVNFIISELLKLKSQNSKISVGIITPHTNQQKLLAESISKLPEKDYLYDVLSLKIMTFDTCQGEERDLIFYSMVANRFEDKLWGVFIKDLNKIDVEEDGQIKAQRLNVGFSRAKEAVHFVLSKPLDEFTGSIGEALRHFYFQKEEASKERGVEEVDPNSPMEREVLNWFYQTEFWNTNKQRTELFPQFNIGAYLKQLDPTYKHPLYKVDFLLIYRDEKDQEQKMIIEYDGFSEHFSSNPLVNAQNYEEYLDEGDVYRQKVLESYGYNFLRINKFNVGNDPIATLNERLLISLKKKTTVHR